MPGCRRSVWGLTINRCDGIGSNRRCTTTFVNTPCPCSRTFKERKRINDALHCAQNNKVENRDIESDAPTNNDQLQVRSTPKGEWIDGKQMMQILAREKAEEQRRNQQQLQQRKSFQARSSQSSSNLDTVDFVSRISYTDANTLQIDIPSTGVDANTVATGAFSALWFSAVAPATVSMLAGGILPALFMAPFWLAGGVVAKTAVYDPFISSTLSIGQYLWTVEKKYLKSVGSLNTKREEGSTESLKGASVELAMVVNNVGRYQLRLFFDGNDSITFGKGLAVEELEHLSQVINEHFSKLQGQSQG